MLSGLIYILGAAVTAYFFSSALDEYPKEVDKQDYWIAYGLALVWPLAWLAVAVVIFQAWRRGDSLEDIEERIDALSAEDERNGY